MADEGYVDGGLGYVYSTVIDAVVANGSDNGDVNWDAVRNSMYSLDDGSDESGWIIVCSNALVSLVASTPVLLAAVLNSGFGYDVVGCFNRCFGVARTLCGDDGGVVHTAVVEKLLGRGYAEWSNDEAYAFDELSDNLLEDDECFSVTYGEIVDDVNDVFDIG